MWERANFKNYITVLRNFKQKMHLKCDCLIQNRIQLSSKNCHVGQQTKKKPIRSIITLGTEKSTKKVLMKISTVTNKELFLINVNENVEQIFDKFIADGKLTIRIKQPEVDILISKVDFVALNSFAKCLKSTSNGGEMDKKSAFTIQKTIQAKDFVKGPTILTIDERKFYPFSSPIANSLEIFQATNCKLTQFDLRILKLRNLKSLDLSNNCLKTNLNQMNFATHKNLTEMKLNSNDLDELPVEFWTRLPPNLSKFHLKNNCFRSLPDVVWSLKLQVFDVSFNKLNEISWRIENLRPTLKYLNVSNNELTELPACLLKFKLDFVDLSSNPYRMPSLDEKFYEGNRFGNVDTLQNYTFKTIFENKLPTNSLPPRLRPQTEEAVRYCAVCTKICLVSSSRMIVTAFDVKHIASNFVLLQGQRFQTVPLIGFCCSTKCFHDFTKGRYKIKRPIASNYYYYDYQ